MRKSMAEEGFWKRQGLFAPQAARPTVAQSCKSYMTGLRSDEELAEATPFRNERR